MIPGKTDLYSLAIILQAGRVKAHELREQSKEELLTLLDDRKTELAQLRVAKVTQGAASKLSQMYVVHYYFCSGHQFSAILGDTPITRVVCASLMTICILLSE
mgnify:CR=1 FL=1